MASSAAAADLPKDILNSIQKLLCLVDYLRFPAVCRSWRSAARQNPHPPKPDPMPWAIYFDSDSGSAVAIQFSSQNDSPWKTYRIPLPPNFNHHIISSSDHRLITINTDVEEELYVLNPFSSSWAPTARLPSPGPYLKHPHGCLNKLYSIVTDGSSAAVGVAEFWGGRFLDYTRLGLGSSSGRCWIRLEHDVVKIRNTGNFVDIVPCRRRRGLFYAARFPKSVGATVVALDFSSPDVVKVEDMTLNLRVDYISTENIRDPYQWFENVRLVCSSSHLFLVWWRLKGENGVRGEMKTRKIDVYKLLDEIPEKRRWVQVRSLDNCSFFLGFNPSISFSADEFPELRPDCIYLPWVPFQCIAEDDDHPNDFEYKSIYNMKDGSWERFYGLDDQSFDHFGRILWIIPHLVWNNVNRGFFYIFFLFLVLIYFIHS